MNGALGFVGDQTVDYSKIRPTYHSCPKQLGHLNQAGGRPGEIARGMKAALTVSVGSQPELLWVSEAYPQTDTT